MVNIAVLGYGTVGSGVVEVINTNHASINKRAGADINIKYVLDLRDFPGDPVEKVLVHDYDVIANDPEVYILFPCNLHKFRAVFGNQCLIGCADTLSGFQSTLHEGICRFDPTHNFYNNIHFRIICDHSGRYAVCRRT